MERIEIAPGYRVPPIIVGLWQLSAGHRASTVELAATLDELERFVDAGFDTFDCADIYTGVEEVLGALNRRLGKRNRFQVHTKFVPDREALASIDREYVTGIIDRSLARLGVERLDMVQFSWWDYDIPGYVETLGWLGELQRQGKIAHLGSTNFDVPRLKEMAMSGVRLASHQVQYSLLDRRPENGLVEYCTNDDAWLFCYGSLAGGLLSQRWFGASSPQAPWPNRSVQKYRLIVEDFGGWPAFQELLARLGSVAAEHGVEIANVAAKAVLDRPRVGAIIVGARDASHLDDNLRTLQMCLNAQDLTTIRQLLSAYPGPIGDVFGLERIAASPHASIMRYNLNRGPDKLG